MNKNNLYSKTLDNGFKIIIKEDKSIDVAIVLIGVRTGSKNEDKSNYGVSHFLEHLFFKGSKNYGPGEIDYAIDSLGARNNAATSEDYTFYYAYGHSDNFLKLLDIESDMILNITLDPKEINRERNVVLSEIDRAEDNNYHFLWDQLKTNLFKDNCYKHPVLGYKNIIENITPKNIRKYYSTYYVPNNMFLVAVGNIDSKKVMPEIENIYKNIPFQKFNDVPKKLINRKTNQLKIEKVKDVNQVYSLTGFLGPDGRCRDNFVMDLISGILSIGKSCRLNKKLVLPGIASDAHIFYETQKYPGITRIYYACEPGKVKKVETILKEEVDRLKTEKISNKELQKIKNFMKAKLLFEMENIPRFATHLMFYEALDSYKILFDYTDIIDSINSSEIMEVAGKYLNMDDSTNIKIIPKKRGL